MNKKTYETPTLIVFETLMDQSILTGSVTTVQTNGLDGEEKLERGTEGDPWENAMGRRQNVWDDSEMEEDQ